MLRTGTDSSNTPHTKENTQKSKTSHMDSHECCKVRIIDTIKNHRTARNNNITRWRGCHAGTNFHPPTFFGQLPDLAKPEARPTDRARNGATQGTDAIESGRRWGIGPVAGQGRLGAEAAGAEVMAGGAAGRIPPWFTDPAIWARFPARQQRFGQVVATGMIVGGQETPSTELLCAGANLGLWYHVRNGEWATVIHADQRPIHVQVCNMHKAPYTTGKTWN
jgi:hypothetical protein